MTTYGVLPFGITICPDKDDNTIISEALFEGTPDAWYSYLEEIGMGSVVPVAKALVEAYEINRKRDDLA